MYYYDYETFEFDTNGDGFADTYIEAYDTNGDGGFDRMEMMADTNGDGYAETLVTAMDTNHSGQYDTFVKQQDTNGDGAVNLVTTSHDYNQDGAIDSVTIHSDRNGDGQFDHVTKSYDSDRDGVIDKVDIYVDESGSGEADFHQEYTINSEGLLIPSFSSGFSVGGTIYSDLEQYQPDGTYPDGMSGDPAESMEYWEFQGDTNRCALYSQKFVIENLSPDIDHLDIEEFAAIAKWHGWFTEEDGTSLLNMNNMLNYYGIVNEMSFHNSIEDIENCLNQGGKVIVSIDAHEIWYGEDDNIFAPDSSSNHAVEVIGVDRSDPEHPMVILNDSGLPTGQGEMVPLDVFEGAWEDGDCQMIECYPSVS